MSEAFHTKLAFALKVLSVSRGALAAELEVDKSLVGRWVTGAVKPSAHNLARLSAYVARRVDGFSVLDWERSAANLAVLLGADPQTAPVSRTATIALPFPLVEESRATTVRRGSAYEGFFRSTRPFAQMPGHFIHDQMLIRRDEDQNLRFEMATAGVSVRGWVWLMQNQLFVVSAEMTSGAFGYAIINGVNSVKAGVLDGLTLTCSLDPIRSPTAAPIYLERVGDLSGDPAADEARFAELAKQDAVAPDGSVPPEIVRHLSRDFGPSQIATGGDWLLSLPASRSLSRGF